MSILKKPYEISIWDDIWDSASGKFVERRLAIIGSNKMTSPGRALEPTLTREVSGNRSFAFKMYKNYVDPLTGENVINPFVQYLVAERKVKLKYGKKIAIVAGVEEEVDCWYDFLIKNISEPSATGLYAYTLEDAHVVELSKNGFNVIFDEQQSNNLGTLDELATRALEDTDWTVETEKFVQKIEEPLVHLIATQEIRAHHIIDEFGTAEGVTIEEVQTLIPIGSQVLAFYSCCKNKPYRFQFLYKADNKFHTDERQIVDDYNCQYYIDYPRLEESYTVKNTDYGIAIPTGFSLAINPKFDNKNDSTISLLAKGGRFGFTQKSKYSDLFDRYMLQYIDTNKETYWGYDESTVVSPVLLDNLVSGSACTSTDGWTGAYSTTSSSYHNKGNLYKTKIQSLIGRWIGTSFKTNSELIAEGFNSDTDALLLQPCLKVEFPALKSLTDAGLSISNMLINAGFYDNKQLIKTLRSGDKYILRIKIRDKNGRYLQTLTNWDIHLKECTYASSSGTYAFGSSYGSFVESGVGDGYITGEYIIDLNSPMTEEEFQNKTIKLVFTPGVSSEKQIYYIEALEFFRRYDAENGEYIPLSSNSEILQVQTITNRCLYKDSELFGDDKVSAITQLNEIKTQNLYYDIYKPVLYSTAEKQRSITIKESNYFNILQTLAETFEAWLEIDITRSAIGAVTGKKIRFNNYIGQNNYASFRYGVNLTDITRRHDSKTVVTKMVVKDNLNEHAPNGFCTIQRAGSNLTGENVLYNFDYYVSTGLMNGVDLNKYLYQEATIANGLKYGYYTRLGQLNEIIRSKSDELSSLITTKAKLEGNIIAAEAKKNQANTAHEQAALDFESLVGKPYTSTEIDEQTSARSDVTRYYTKILTNLKAEQDATIEWSVLQSQKVQLDQNVDALQSEIDDVMNEKKELNAQFYAKYYRFIQEGTWIKEDYIDDEKYYVDAQAALYNSCYPKVTYSINVMEISQLPGYDHFSFDLGDITYAEDPELFGEEGRAEVIITELSQNLDNPSKNTIKVQTYKNQFQDLFQKLTATSQQVQYNTGSYKKAERMASADNVLKREFLKGTLEDMSTLLESAGEQDVRWGEYGLIVQDMHVKSKQIRMVGGAILLSKENSDGVVEWVTGITSDGIAADLLTAGKINTEQIQIMAGSEPSFRWDAYGITAYDFIKADTLGGSVINGLNLKKFTRFDRFGFYGAEIDKKIINGIVYQDGSAWHPETAEEIMENANFALTWEGLKVQGGNNLIAFIGKHDDYIVRIGKNTQDYLTFSNDGILKIGGWQVEQNGLLYKTAGKQTPELLFSTIGNKCTFNEGESNSFELDNVILKAGNKFMVTTDGQLYANNAYLYGGKIGFLTINEDGSLESNNWRMTDGRAVFPKAVNIGVDNVTYSNGVVLLETSLANEFGWPSGKPGLFLSDHIGDQVWIASHRLGVRYGGRATYFEEDWYDIMKVIKWCSNHYVYCGYYDLMNGDNPFTDGERLIEIDTGIGDEHGIICMPQTYHYYEEGNPDNWTRSVGYPSITYLGKQDNKHIVAIKADKDTKVQGIRWIGVNSVLDNTTMDKYAYKKT